ncbi:ACT domain-containing protein, partial [Bacillus safensis]|nr:ACT domain-containing protein [Bacillus safensis]
DVTSMTCDLDDLIQQLKRLDFVESAEVISSGAL